MSQKKCRDLLQMLGNVSRAAGCNRERDMVRVTDLCSLELSPLQCMSSQGKSGDVVFQGLRFSSRKCGLEFVSVRQDLQTCTYMEGLATPHIFP